MTLTSKYYTPELSELHVGFACEYQEPDEVEWTQDTSLAVRDVAYLMAYPERVRVKHLDQEDIESLGFEKDLKEVAGMNWRMISFQKGELTVDLFVELPKDLIRGDGTNGYVKPQTVRIEDSCRVLFNGILKNKSELKKILKQIGYE
tara:strand:- start:680 stop:1120 length:441 start_codon:yes stop_codon:yes gene_type:complete